MSLRQERSDDGWHQLGCAILYHHVHTLAAIGSGKKTSGIMEDLVEIVTFVESETCLLLCDLTEIDYDSYLKKMKELFLALDKSVQDRVLKGADDWWEAELAVQDAGLDSP